MGSRPTLRHADLLRVLLVLVCALYGLEAEALDRSRRISELEHRTWRSRDGAPSQIHALAQTTDGYLWIGSAQGLFRFDAVTFEEYVPQPGVRLPSHNIYALLATADGGLWIAFRPNGLAFLKGGRLTVLGDDALPADSRIHNLAIDTEGRLWAGSESGLFVRDGGRWRGVGDDWNIPAEMVRTQFVDSRGTHWVGTVNRVAYRRKGTRTFETTPTAVKRGLTGFAEDGAGRVWYAEDQIGIARPVPLGGSAAGDAPAIVMPTLNQLLFDRDGALWMTGLNASRIMRVRHPEALGSRTIGRSDPDIESFDELDGAVGGQAYRLLEDREGNLWVGSSNGLDRFRQSAVVSLRLPQTYQGLTLLPSADGDIWVGNNDNQPLLRIRGHDILSEPSGAGRKISSVYRAPDGTVWWGCYNGLWRQRDARFEFFPLPGDVIHDYIYEIFPSATPGLWVRVGDVGVVHFLDGRFDFQVRPAGLPELGPSATYVAADGRVWLGYRTGEVYVLDGQRATRFGPEAGLNVGRIKVIRGVGAHIWIGGELGPMLFSGGRFHEIRTADGTRFGAVSGIVDTGEHGVWLNELRGIEHIPAAEVRRLVANPVHPVAYRRYNTLDGILAPPQMNFTNSAAVRGVDGRVWFATDNGLVWIDPTYAVTNRLPPPVSILSIRSEQQRHTSLAGVVFAAGTRAVEIDYTALSLSIPERIAFRYRLDGVDDHWQDVGNRRQAYYTSMAPGRYRFHVIAANDDGVWNDRGAHFDFEIRPPWWNTAVFRAVAVFAVLLAGYAGYAHRVRQIGRQFEGRLEARLAERTRIARELHDTLIQGFQGLMFRLQAVRDLLPDRTSEATAALEVALERGSQAIADGRDAVQGLRASALGRQDLVRELRTLGEELAAAQAPRGGTVFRLTVEGPPQFLDPVVGHDVYRIAAEALSNAFRHARASAIDAVITYGDEMVRVRVRDDGKGLDAGILDRGGRAGHWGLAGMRERARALGGSLEVSSQDGAGTEVELAIPLRGVVRSAPWRTRWGALSRRGEASELQS
jgi:signal transduction histidine kinase/ligand-binding sensor domain-containing protein